MSHKLTKKEIVEKLQEANKGLSKTEVTEVYNSLLEILFIEITENNRTITLSGIGTFSVQQGLARLGRDIVRGKMIKIPTRKRIKFSPSKQIKDFFKK